MDEAARRLFDEVRRTADVQTPVVDLEALRAYPPAWSCGNGKRLWQTANTIMRLHDCPVGPDDWAFCRGRGSDAVRVWSSSSFASAAVRNSFAPVPALYREQAAPYGLVMMMPRVVRYFGTVVAEYGKRVFEAYESFATVEWCHAVGEAYIVDVVQKNVVWLMPKRLFNVVAECWPSFDALDGTDASATLGGSPVSPRWSMSCVERTR